MATTQQRRSPKPSPLATAKKAWRTGMKLLAMLDFLEDLELIDKYRERLWAKVNRLTAIISDLDNTPLRVRKASKKEREIFLVDVQKYLKKL